MHARSSAARTSRFIPAPRPQPHSRTVAAKGSYEVEYRSGTEMLPHLDAWRGLTARALEPTLACDPDMLLPALRHTADGRSVTLMLVWRRGEAGRALCGVFPLVLPRAVLGFSEVSLWRLGASAFATPLIDRDRSVEIIEAALDALNARRARCVGFMLPRLLAGAPAADAIAGAARRKGCRLDRFAGGSGAWLLPAPSEEAATPRTGSPGAATSGEVGAKAGVHIEHARTAREVRDAVETFLVLEARSATARRRAPLVQDPGATSFLRTMTRQFAHRRRCRVDVVQVDGKAVLAAIAMETPGAVWLWSVAVLPEGERLRPAILATIAGRAQRGRKTLYVLHNAALDEEGAHRLGLKPLPLIDMLISTHARPSPRAVAVHLKGRLDRRVRTIASESYRRVKSLMPRPAAAAG